MDIEIRDARAEDKTAISAFTEDTFTWGDYVVDAFDRWLADPDGKLLVGVDSEGTAVAMGRGVLLSGTELWLQGARVHPDWRRRGIASAIDTAIEAWARDQAAQVSRLAVEDWNVAARRQVERIGMRQVGSWLVAERDVPSGAPAPATNGGRRPPPQDRLVGAASAEAAPAFMAWSTGPLGKAARQLLATGWTWRRLSMDDLIGAARRNALWMSPAGWVMAAVDDGTLEVGWIESSEGDIGDLIRATVDLATELGTERIEIKAPDITWLARSLESQGFTLTKMLLYAKAL